MSTLTRCREAETLLVQAYQKKNSKELVSQALKIYESILETEPQFTRAILGFAYILYSAGDLEQAARLCQYVQQIEPANMHAVVMAGRIKKDLTLPRVQPSSLIELNALTRLHDTVSPATEEALHLCQQWLATKQSFDLPPWDDLFN